MPCDACTLKSLEALDEGEETQAPGPSDSSRDVWLAHECLWRGGGVALEFCFMNSFICSSSAACSNKPLIKEKRGKRAFSQQSQQSQGLSALVDMVLRDGRKQWFLIIWTTYRMPFLIVLMRQLAYCLALIPPLFLEYVIVLYSFIRCSAGGFRQ